MDNIEFILKKLQVLVPEKTRNWAEILRLGDPWMKRAIEEEIRLEAVRNFGQNLEHLPLSLPPKELSRGPIHLGKVIYGAVTGSAGEVAGHWEFGIHPEELIQNLFVAGRSGSGKTNLVLGLLEQLTKAGVPWVMLDWKRNGRDLLTLPSLRDKIRIATPGSQISPLGFNPFAVPEGQNPLIYLQQVVDLMRDPYVLGVGADSLLTQTLRDFYASGNLSPSVQDLIAALENLPVEEISRGWQLTALRALRRLELSSLGGKGSPSDFQALLTGSTVIELDALSDQAKRFLIPLIVLNMYYALLIKGPRERLRLVVIIEEAHNVMHARQGEGILETILRQCREVGMGMIIVDQSPSLISPVTLQNCYTTLLLHQKNPADIVRSATLAGLEGPQYSLLGRLPVGQGVLRLSGRWVDPVLLAIPRVRVEKGIFDDKALGEVLSKRTPLKASDTQARDAFRHSGPIDPPHNAFGHSGAPRDLPQDAFVFLRDILDQSESPVSERYQRLRWNVERGTKIQRLLLDYGLIEASAIKVGRTRRRILRLSSEGRQVLGLASSGQGSRESLAHAYWKQSESRRLAGLGWKGELEASRPSPGIGKADWWGTKESLSMALEIETGKSNALGNVLQNLMAGADLVRVLAVDKTAFDKVHQELSDAGLLIKRVELALAA